MTFDQNFSLQMLFSLTLLLLRLFSSNAQKKREKNTLQYSRGRQNNNFFAQSPLNIVINLACQLELTETRGFRKSTPSSFIRHLPQCQCQMKDFNPFIHVVAKSIVKKIFDGEIFIQNTINNLSFEYFAKITLYFKIIVKSRIDSDDCFWRNS